MPCFLAGQIRNVLVKLTEALEATSSHWSENVYLFYIALHRREIIGRVHGYLRGEYLNQKDIFSLQKDI